jgi:neutral ceramidase
MKGGNFMPLLKCGFAQRDITPVPGTVFLDGYGFRLTPAEGIRDRLYVKVCAIECGDDRFALFSFDLCGMSAQVYDYIAGHIEGLTGMDRSRFALTCIHTHAGPACGLLDGLPLYWDWFASAAEKAAEALAEAHQNARPGQFHMSICGELRHMFNRRGRTPIDRRIRCAVFTGEDGNVRGIIASAACHAVVNTSMNISADYPAVLTQEVEKRYPGVPAIFINGRGADIDPYNPDSLTREELLVTLGHELADCALNFADTVAGKYKEALDTEIVSDYRLITVPMKPFSAEDVYRREITRLTDAYKNEKDAVTKHCILRELDYHRSCMKKLRAGISPDITVPLQILLIKNTAVFVMMPFEVLTLTGNKIEEMLCNLGFAPESVFICGYTNSVNGYLAPIEEFEYGGYEVAGAAHWYGIAECCEQSVETVLKNIDSMMDALTKR